MTPTNWSTVGFAIFILIVIVGLYVYLHKDDFWGGGW
jgi:hypothetical protein